MSDLQGAQMSLTKNFHHPPAHQGDTIETYHGTAIADPYRWLEDPDSAETQAWVAAQNELTQGFLAELTSRPQIEQRLTSLWDYPKYSTPEERHGRYFYHHNNGLQNQAVLVQQEALDGQPVVLIDPNQLSDDGTIALTNQSFSDDGTLLAYGLSQSGSDWQHIHIRPTKTGAEYDEVIEWSKFTPIAWLKDNSGFFYARYPAPGEMPDAPPSTHHRLYYHQLGTSQAEDRLIYARPDAPELGFSPQVTDDGRYLLLHVWEGTDRRNRFYYRKLDCDDDFIRLIDSLEAKYNFITNDGPIFYFETDLDAPKGRLIAIDVGNPARENWREIIPEGPDAVAFSTIVNNQFVIATLHDAHHCLTVYDVDGTAVNEIPLPTLGSIAGLTGKRPDTEMFINFQSFLYPPTIFRYDFTTRQLETFRQPTINFDPSGYETHLVFATSKDGTQIPIFLTHLKGLKRDRSHPTLLYGYGGFTVNMTPAFSPTRLIWLEMGGIYAQAVLRGGNEYGESWHEAGMLANKQNVFDDFISAAEWLIANGYTCSERLAIQGGSNGGLLVAACLIQRPDLFGAVHCAVPVTDMLRYHKFTAGRYWTGEYGNAEENPDHFRFMLAYSPLHNIQPGTTHPPTLITTADTDDRVVPLHAKKFAAALQTADSGHNPLLLRIETKAGHGLGKPTSKLIEENSDVYAFLWTILMKGGN
jgi:prolyl oligopeptidase